MNIVDRSIYCADKKFGKKNFDIQFTMKNGIKYTAEMPVEVYTNCVHFVSLDTKQLILLSIDSISAIHILPRFYKNELAEAYAAKLLAQYQAKANEDN